MNNMNYLGSSLLIINMDLNYKFQKEAENDNSFDSMNEKKKGSKRNKKNSHNDFYEKENQKVTLPPIK